MKLLLGDCPFEPGREHDRPDVPADKENGNTMAVRTRRESAVTDVKGVPAESKVTMPAAWGAEPIEEFSGHDLTEKKELVGVPFLILGAEIERNENRDYEVIYVYAMDANGVEFEFSDTSTTGILAQLRNVMLDKDLRIAPGAGFQKFRLACMKGLRVSEFEFTDEASGKKRKAATYYLGATGSSRQ